MEARVQELREQLQTKQQEVDALQAACVGRLWRWTRTQQPRGRALTQRRGQEMASSRSTGARGGGQGWPGPAGATARAQGPAAAAPGPRHFGRGRERNDSARAAPLRAVAGGSLGGASPPRVSRPRRVRGGGGGEAGLTPRWRAAEAIHHARPHQEPRQDAGRAAADDKGNAGKDGEGDCRVGGGARQREARRVHGEGRGAGGGGRRWSAHGHSRGVPTVTRTVAAGGVQGAGA